MDAKAKTGMTRSRAVALVTKLKPSLFKGLSVADVEAIVAAARFRRFAANSVITNEGEHAEQLFLILEGSARAFTISPEGTKAVIVWVTPGRIIGWSALMPEPVGYVLSTEGAKAAHHSSALVWDRSTAKALAVKYPRLMENALLLGYDYMATYRGLHLAALCDSAPQRLAQVLCVLAKGIGHPVGDGMELRIRNEELADEAHVTIFTVSRLMRDWQRHGLVKKSRGNVVVLKMEELLRVGT